MPPPDTTLIAPPADAVVSGVVTLQATAVDHSGSGIWFVAFNYDTTHLIDVDYLASSGVYEVTWDTNGIPDGEHLIGARAADNASGGVPGAFSQYYVRIHNAPPPPVNLSTISLARSIQLSWEPASTDPVDTWNIYRYDGTFPIQVGSVPGGTFTFTDTGLENGTTYTYVVTALDSFGNESYLSLPVSDAPHIPPPALTGFAQTLYDELAPLQYADQGYDYPLAYYCSALAKPFDDLWDYVVTPDTPWSTIVDLDTTPASFLEWLGRFKGVASLRADLTDAARRDEIRHAAGFDRGTITTMIAAAKRNLRNTKHVTSEERVGGSAWQIRFTVYTSEVATSNAELLADVLAVKPAGIVFTLVVSTSETWNEATHTWNSASGTWDAATSGI